MNQSEMRSIALGATRGKMRVIGIDPTISTPDDALAVLDDTYRVSPDLVASIWYGGASDAQLNLFRKEWKQWQRKQ